MTPPDNILEELQSLDANFGHHPSGPAYAVPQGYFSALPELILQRIKAMEAVTAKDEIAALSPLLSGLSRVTPFTVPAGYFEELSELVPFFAEGETNTEPSSALLSSLSKELPYTVPVNYFQELQSPVASAQTKNIPAKVVSMEAHKSSKSWLRYAAAAVVIGFIAVSGFLFFNRSDSADSIAGSNSFAWVEKNLKTVSTEDIDRFVESTGADNVIAQVSAPDDIKKLMSDVSDKDIQDFLNDTPVDESDTDELLFN